MVTFPSNSGNRRLKLAPVRLYLSLRYVKLTSMVSLGDLSFIFIDTKERPR